MIIEKIKIIIIDDEKHIIDEIEKTINNLFKDELSRYEPEIKKSTEPNLNVAEDKPDIAFIDYKFDNSNVNGYFLAKKLKEKYPSIINVIITAEESFIDIRRMESTDNLFIISGWIPKPFRPVDIRKELIALISDKEKNEQIASLSSRLNIATTIPLDEVGKKALNVGIVYRSKIMAKALNDALTYAQTPKVVLLQGESGTGKELFAKLIADNSNFNKSKYFPVNAGSINESTITSELFGVKKGGYTGAISDRKGYFEEYDSGIVFLDEINSLPLEAQVMLLRVIENGELIRVGDSKIIKVEVKIICGTNQDLSDLVSQSKFRQDLLNRINQFKIVIPPLRERDVDIELLLKHYLNKFNTQYHKNLTFDDNALNTLIKYNYKEGNVRELNGIVEKLVLFGNSIITFDLIKEKVSQVLEEKTDFKSNPQQESQVATLNIIENNSFNTGSSRIIFSAKEKNNMKDFLSRFLKAFLKYEIDNGKYPNQHEIEPILEPSNNLGWLSSRFTKTKEPKNCQLAKEVIDQNSDLHLLKQITPFKKLFS
ncbi:hypothetical protein MASR2M69_08570 [Bacteroidota bacterium]